MQPKKSENFSKEELEDYNKLMTEKEAEQLEAFVKAKKWPVEKSGTGLYYWIYQNGEGPNAKPGQTVEVNLTITLLSGDTAYTHLRYGSERFLIDRTDKESGLNEGVQYMNKGAKAKLVMPSHLAHGLAGDLDRIPPRSSLVFDVELLDIN
ncbi:MAG: FKBP-type peptidyl-prolyl cis-trans isomerase [Luteibaculum sp.]